MAYLAVTVAWGGSIAGACYLVTHDHPMFAVFLLVCGFSASATSKKAK